jgi:ribosomal protein S18 acetylase RimI-like enzyme
MTGITVRCLAAGDLPAAARLHATLLPHGFFPRLGQRFLRAYYRTFMSSPHGIGLVACVAGQPVGVLVGTAHNAAHYRWVIQHHGVSLAWLAILAMLVRPTVAVWFVRTRLRRYARRLLHLPVRPAPAGRDAGSGDPAAGDLAVLTHVMVSGDTQGRGIGTALVERFAVVARTAGASRAMLVTFAGQDGASAFYKRLGWEHLEDRPSRDGWQLSVLARPL